MSEPLDPIDSPERQQTLAELFRERDDQAARDLRRKAHGLFSQDGAGEVFTLAEAETLGLFDEDAVALPDALDAR